MPDIYLARHGEDKDNAEGILNGRRDRDLTDRGKRQARNLAYKIRGLEADIDKVYASPLQRAYNTAEIITEKLGLDSPEEVEELKEREFGCMTGEKAEKIEELPEEELIYTDRITYFLSPEGAETFPELLERGERALETLERYQDSGDILAVAHGDIGKMVYAAYYDLEWEDVLRDFYFDNSDLLLLSEDSDPEDAHLFKDLA